jgi:hypothetical protein
MNYPWESNEVGYNKDDTTIPQRVRMQCSDCKYLNVISTWWIMSTLYETTLNPTFIVPKFVRVRPRGCEFLSCISEVAYLCIWSSMILNIVELISDVILIEGSSWLCLVLGQESCYLLHNGKGGVVIKI